jgi:hypothetical protein
MGTGKGITGTDVGIYELAQASREEIQEHGNRYRDQG